MFSDWDGDDLCDEEDPCPTDASNLDSDGDVLVILKMVVQKQRNLLIVMEMGSVMNLMIVQIQKVLSIVTMMVFAIY